MQVGETSRQRLAELLKELRGERSQRSFAKLLGVSNQAVQYWEKERTWPDDNNLERIAELKGWTLLQLQVYLEGEQQRSSVADEDVNRVNDGELQQQSRSVQQLLEEVRMLPFQAAVQVAKVALETMEMMAAKS